MHTTKPTSLKAPGRQELYGGLDASEILARKGVGADQELLHHMGSAELAATLFQVTQAEQRIHREGTTDQTAANRVHEEVGQKVRRVIQELGGTLPEDLPTRFLNDRI